MTKKIIVSIIITIIAVILIVSGVKKNRAQAAHNDFRIGISAGELNYWHNPVAAMTRFTDFIGSITGINSAGPVTDTYDGKDPEWLRLRLESDSARPLINKDFRIGIVAGGKDNCITNMGRVEYTPWASDGGGWSDFAFNLDYSGSNPPDCWYLNVDVRDMPVGKEIKDIRIGLQPYKDGGSTTHTPWLSQGGGISNVSKMVYSGGITAFSQRIHLEVRKVDINSYNDEDFQIAFQSALCDWNCNYSEPDAVGDVRETPWSSVMPVAPANSNPYAGTIPNANLLPTGSNQPFIGWTGWTGRSYGWNKNTSFRTGINIGQTFPKNKDFRLVVQQGANLGARAATGDYYWSIPRYTPWASEGGGWSTDYQFVNPLTRGWAEGPGKNISDDFSRDSLGSLRFRLELRDWPADHFFQLRDFRIGIQLADGESDTDSKYYQFGDVVYSGWASQGGGWSGWTHDTNAEGQYGGTPADVVRIKLELPGNQGSNFSEDGIWTYDGTSETSDIGDIDNPGTNFDHNYHIKYLASGAVLVSGQYGSFSGGFNAGTGTQFVRFPSGVFKSGQPPPSVVVARNWFRQEEEMVRVFNIDANGVDPDGFYYEGNGSGWQCIKPDGSQADVSHCGADLTTRNDNDPGYYEAGVYWVAVQGNVPGKIYAGFQPNNMGRRVHFPWNNPEESPFSTTPEVVIAKNWEHENFQMFRVYNVDTKGFSYAGELGISNDKDPSGWDCLNRQTGDRERWSTYTCQSAPSRMYGGIYWIATEGNILNNQIQSGFQESDPNPTNGNPPNYVRFPVSFPAGAIPAVVVARNFSADEEQMMRVYDVTNQGFYYAGDAAEWICIDEESGDHYPGAEVTQYISGSWVARCEVPQVHYGHSDRAYRNGIYWIAVYPQQLDLGLRLDDTIQSGTFYKSVQTTAADPGFPILNCSETSLNSGIVRCSNIPEGFHSLNLTINIPGNFCGRLENKVELFYGDIRAGEDYDYTQVNCGGIIGDVYASENISISDRAVGVVSAGGDINLLTDPITEPFLKFRRYSLNEASIAHWGTARSQFNPKSLDRIKQRARDFDLSRIDLNPDQLPEGGVWLWNSPINGNLGLNGANFSNRGTIIVEGGGDLIITGSLGLNGIGDAVGFIVLDGGDVRINSGGGSVNAAIFAPDGNITINTTGSLDGLFVAKEINILANSQISYDPKIAGYYDMGPGILYHPLPGFGQLIAPLIKEVAP